MRKSSAATSKPASKPAGKPTTGNAGKNSTSAGSKLWEKKPFDKSNKPSSFKGSKPYGDKGDGSKKPYQSNMKKRKDHSNSELDPASSKKQRKVETAEQIKERKMLKPNAPLVADVLRLWGEFSQKTKTKEEKHKIIDQLLKEAKGKIYDIVFRGTASRVFQSVLKEGHGAHRAQVFEELKEHTVEMAKNAYAHRLLMRMLKYCTIEQTDVLIKQLYGNVCNLMRQRDASKVIEYIYSDDEIGRPLQKLALVEEFYGVEFATFKPTKKRTLEDILLASPEKKGPILAHLRSKLMPIVAKADMSILLNHTIIHLPLLKLIEHSSFAENDEMIEALKDNLVRLVHSKEGAKIACHCFAYGSPKARKAIIKSLKGYVLKIALEQHGHVLLLRIFDVMDDTVLVSKAIIFELKPHLLELAQDRFGRLILLALLSPKNKRYFTVETLDLLQPVFVPEKREVGEDGKPVAPTSEPKLVAASKKNPEIRQVELYNAIIPELRTMAKSQAFRMLIHIYARDVYHETIVTSTAVVDAEEKASLLNSVLRLVGDPADNGDKMEEDEVSKEFHALDFMKEKPLPEEDIMTHYLVHRSLRRFIEEEPGFDKLLLEKIGDRVWDYTSKQFSSWVIYSLLVSADTSAAVKKVLVAHKSELAELAKVDLNKAAQAIQTYLKDPKASLAARSHSGQDTETESTPTSTAKSPAKSSKSTKATEGKAKASASAPASEKKEKPKKTKSVPLVEDDETTENKESEPAKMEVDESSSAPAAEATPSKKEKRKSMTPSKKRV